jgi:hypothetical protein
MSKKSSASNAKDQGPILTLPIMNFRESSVVQDAASRIAPSVLQLLLADAVEYRPVYGPRTREVTGSGDNGGRSTLQDLLDDHADVRDMFIAEVRLGVMWQANVDIGNAKNLSQDDETYLAKIFKPTLDDKQNKVHGPDEVWNKLSPQGRRLVTEHLKVIEEEALDRHIKFMVDQLGYSNA